MRNLNSRWREKKPRTHRLAITFASIFAIAICAGALSAPTARADTIFTVAHVCQTTQYNDGLTQGVFCADLLEETGGTDIVVGLRVEGLCQNLSDSTTTQCSNVVVYGGTYDTAGDSSGEYWSAACGHQNGNCSTGRNYFGLTTSTSYDAIFVDPGDCRNIWGVVFASSPKSFVTLPGSGYDVGLASNLSTGHFTICN